MVFVTFNIVLVIYRTCVVGRGVQEAHGFCHFQYCFSHLPHMCCRQGGSGGSYFLPLSKMFQSFTTPLLWAGWVSRLMFYATFNNVSVFFRTCAVVRAFRRLMFYATFNIQSFTTHFL